jgi:hypothetical protein
MTTPESLMDLVGKSAKSADVQTLVVADGLIPSTEPDLQEGEPPRGYLSCPAGGYSFSHNGDQIDTLFVFVVPTDEYRAFSASLSVGLSPSSTRGDVRRAFGKPSRSGEAMTISGLGRKGAWDRFKRGSQYLHFEYTEPETHVRQITVMTADTTQ